jgi:hypothetical protein
MCQHIVIWKPVSRKRVGKHLSAEILFLETNHRLVLIKRVHGCGNESCRFLETSSLLWNQQACPWIRTFNKHFPRIPPRYVSGRSDKNSGIRKSVTGIGISEGIRKVTRNQVRTTEDRLEKKPVAVQSEWSVLGSNWLWAVVIGCD